MYDVVQVHEVYLEYADHRDRVAPTIHGDCDKISPRKVLLHQLPAGGLLAGIVLPLLNEAEEVVLGADGNVRTLHKIVLNPSVGLPSGLDELGPHKGMLIVANINGKLLNLLLQILGRMLWKRRELMLQTKEILHVRKQLVGVDGIVGIELTDLHQKDLGLGHGVDGHGVQAEEGQLFRCVHRRLAQAGEGVVELGTVGAYGGLLLILDLTLGTGVTVVVGSSLGTSSCREILYGNIEM